MPHVGSSSSKSRGSEINAIPISSIATSPYDSVPAARRASAVMPICSSVRSTRSWASRSFSAARNGCRKRRLACLVTHRFSATLNWLNTLLICSVRLTPSRLISCGFNPVISWPRKRIRPLFGRSIPDTRLKNVVLPAPFGPIMACKRPDGRLRLRLSVATKPPKRFVRSSVRRTGSLMALSAPVELERQYWAPTSGRRHRAIILRDLLAPTSQPEWP